MKRFGLRRLLLVVAIVAVLSLHYAVVPDHSQRSYQIFPEMSESVAYETQASLEHLGEGRPLVPPAGSAAIGFPAFRYAPTPEDAVRAGVELQNPVDTEDRETLDRGAFVYRTFCGMCHGADGKGQGEMTKRGVPPPPSLLAERAREMKDGQMYHLLTLGQGNMASYASQVDRIDRLER